MKSSQLNFQTIFECAPGAYLVVQADENFTIVAVSNNYLQATKTHRETIINKGLFEIFPDNPEDALANGTHHLRASLERVICDKKIDTMPVQKYDIPLPAEEGGGFEKRYWSPINTPIVGENGDIEFILHRVEDVTEYILLKQQKNEHLHTEKTLRAATDKMEIEVYNSTKEIHLAEEALRDVKERYNILTSLLPVGVFNIDPEGCILYVNPYWIEITKSGLKNLQYKFWYQIVYPEDKQEIAKKWDLGKKEENFKAEFRFVSPEGELKWLLVQIQPETKSNGDVAGYVGALIDITERKQQEQRDQQKAQMLVELDQAKTIFFSNISHEFRTPLTLMIGPLEDSFVDKNYPFNQQQQQRQWLIYRNTLRLLKLVNSLLDFSRIEANKAKAVYEPVNLPQITGSLVSMFDSAVEKAGLKLIIDMPSLEEPVYIDKEMYEKIIFNLLSNAFKFTLHGAISVSLKKRDKYVELYVQDTGIGIKSENLPHIFERFYKVEDTQGRSYEGTGIGLALVQELVKLHHGSIQVSSQVNEGTTFIVTFQLGTAHFPSEVLAIRENYKLGNHGKMFIEEISQWLPSDNFVPLPAAIPVSTSDVVTPLNVSTANKAKILIADDNKDMRAYLKSLLEPYWEVDMATDGASALQAVQRKKPDLILSDVTMPKLNGFQLIQNLKANVATRFIPVILLSARAGAEACVDGLQAGADDYLVKPFSAKELLARVQLHLELGLLRTELEQKVQERTHELAQAKKETEEQQQKRFQEAEAYQKRQEQFIDTLCHEVRNPLNGAYSGTSLLKDTLGLLEDLFKIEEDKLSILKQLKNAKEQLETIDQCTKQQKIIVDDVLNLSQLESNKVIINYSIFKLKTFIEEIIKIFSAQVKAKNLKLHMRIPSHNENAWLKADTQKLTQILINLVSNAIKYTETGEIIIAAEYVASSITESTLCLQVIDTGIGITSEEMINLFDPFVQAKRRTATHSEGSGLGLSISKKLVEMMGGALKVESQNQQGSSFSFTIKCEPLLLEEEAQIRAKESSSNKSSDLQRSFLELEGKNILIVEDNNINQTVLVKLLEKKGCVCHVAENGLEAVKKFTEHVYDGIFMDIEMPVMNGIEATKKIRDVEKSSKRAKTPIIAVTGYVRKEIEESALTAGMDGYITKPYHKENI